MLDFRRTFRSLGRFNYRVWAAGALVSNVGTWMQRIGQDWLVLTVLTHRSGTVLGLVMALQFGPYLLLLPFSGFAADHFDRRRLLIMTQALMGALALALGLLTTGGLVRLWQVELFAFLLGCVAAMDAPARQTFVAELVGDADLPNAVALNSTSFNAARMIGPAAAGVLIASFGTGWLFLMNAASFVAVLVALCLLRVGELHASDRAARRRGSFVEGLRYVGGRPDLVVVLAMLFLFGTFGLNFPIFISTMAVRVFHASASTYGFLTSMMAIGTVVGSLLAAQRTRVDMTTLSAGSAVFGVGCLLAAVSPDRFLFALSLVIIGASALTFTTATNTMVQLSTEPAMRGRVMAMRLGIAVGCTPIGAPIVGWIADRFGPRCSIDVGAAAGLASALVGMWHVLATRSRACR